MHPLHPLATPMPGGRNCMQCTEKMAGGCACDDDTDDDDEMTIRLVMHAELVFTLIASDREFAMSEIIVKTNSVYRTSLANS